TPRGGDSVDSVPLSCSDSLAFRSGNIKWISRQVPSGASNPGPVNWAGIVFPSGPIKLTVVGLAGNDTDGSEKQTGTFFRSCAPPVIVTSKVGDTPKAGPRKYNAAIRAPWRECFMCSPLFRRFQVRQQVRHRPHVDLFLQPLWHE